MKKVLEEYYDFLNVFSKYDSDILPEYQPYDHKIELEPGYWPKELSYSPLYKISLNKLEAI